MALYLAISTDLTQLELINVGLQNVFSDGFDPSNSIRFLNLAFNSIENVDFLSNFREIQVLVLRSNKISSLSANTIANLPELNSKCTTSQEAVS